MSRGPISACWSARNNDPSSKWWSGHILDNLITTAKGRPSFANPRLGELDRHGRRLTTTDAKAGDPTRSPRVSSAPSKVATMRAPEAPIGSPSEVAPPFTFSLSWGMPNSCAAIIATTANASFTSNRSTSSTAHPAFSCTLRIAGTGAVANFAGSWAWAAVATTVAMIGKPCASATLRRVIINAAAPSETEEALAAVIVPSLTKAGLSDGIFSGFAFPGCSSVARIVSPSRPVAVTGTISLANAPLAIASFARLSDRIAKSSWAARVN